MKNMRHYIAVSIILPLAFVLALSPLLPPKQAHASGFPVVDLTHIGVSISNLATAVGNAISTLSLQLKEYALDGLANMLAKQLVHQLAASVVTWINSGFNGSPSFVTDPTTFFENIGDQVTGNFLATCGSLVDQVQSDGTTKKVCSGKPGPLSNLCSPFSTDVRIAIALQQAHGTNASAPYTCTLGKIISNVQNARNPSISVGVSNTSNGMTIGDIINGNVIGNQNAVSVDDKSIPAFYNDFTQGGFPAFMGLSLEMQNNAIGSSLQAASDLNAQISAQQGAVNTDLNRGSGFMSWQKCDTVSTAGTAVKGDSLLGNVNATWGSGATTQQCHTETPGSVISAALNKQLGSPTDELNIADEIDEVVNALVSQLMTQVLSNGLGASTGNGPGDTNSIVDQILNNDGKNSSGVTGDAKGSILSSIGNVMATANSFVAISNQDYPLMVQVRNTCESAGQGNATALDLLVSNDKARVDQASSSLASLQSIQASVQAATTQQTLQTAGEQFSTMVQNGALPNENQINQATMEKTDLDNRITSLSSIPPDYTVCTF